jgi:drug/metabolite transporter (DMT)-like permease
VKKFSSASILNASTSSLNRKAHPVRGYFYIAAATFCWGLSAAMGRAIFTGRFWGRGHVSGSIDPLILAQSRSTIALLLLAPILLLRNPSALRVRGSHVVQFFLLGILGIAGSNYFYYFAIEKTTVATAIVLQYVAPVWVLLYMLARRRQRPTPLRVSGVLLAVVGCGFAVGEIGARSRFPWLAISGMHFNTIGIVAAEMAAITFAFYNVYGQHLLQIYRRWTVARIDHGLFRSLTATGVCVLLVCLGLAPPLTANRGSWFALRWSLGGGVASTRSEGDCELRTDFRRTAQATP